MTTFIYQIQKRVGRACDRRRPLASVLTLLSLGLAGGLIQGCDTSSEPVRREIQSAIKRRDMPDDAPWRDRRTQSLVRAFYTKRSMQPAWTDGGGALGHGRDLAEVVTRAEEEGLNPEDYSAEQLAAHWKENRSIPLIGRDPKALAEFDLLCTIAAFHYMSDLADGRISPKALDAEWVAKPRRGDFDSLLSAALARNRVKKALLELAPTQVGYRKLRAARAQVAKIVAAGGWPTIKPGRPLRRGDRGARVQMLRQRLIASGDLDSTRGAPGVYDKSLENAVKRFQFRNGRQPDGIVDAAEIADLNVPADRRLRQIDLNMERWRWVPRSFGDRYLLVDIPEYALHVVEGRRPVLEMPVVVGKAMTATPVFSDVMTHVVINPDWNIPKSIVQNEIAPAVMNDGEYLTRNHIRVLDGESEEAGEIAAASVDWSDTTELTRLHFRQDPGDDNPLGHIKFLLPNRFDIYLHDTPAGHLFSKEERSFSHGCVRVGNALALAQYVLRGTAAGAPGEIERRIAEETTTTLEIPDPLPVHIVYFTAYVDRHNAVGYRDDVYGIDQNQIEQLWSRERRRASQ